MSIARLSEVSGDYTVSTDRAAREMVFTDSEGRGFTVPFAAMKGLELDSPLTNDLPTNEDEYMVLLDDWQADKAWLDTFKAAELDKRLRLFAGAFVNPVEGTNTHILPDGRHLKGKYTVNRSIDEAALPSVLADLRAQGCANTDVLVRYKPELAKREWNSLSDDHKLVFSAAVVATPGAPAFEVVTPKRRGRAA